MRHEATDLIIKNQYVPLLNEALAALVHAHDEIAEVSKNTTVINSIDFYHLFDFLWDKGLKLADPLLSRNLWTFNELDKLERIPHLNIVASRATMLEICDSLHHEIDRIGEKETNRKILADLRANYASFRYNALELSNYDFDYVSKLKQFESSLPVLGVSSNISGVINLFETKKIMSYYDVIPYEDIRKLRPDIVAYARTISSSIGTYHRARPTSRDAIDEELHKHVDSYNLSTAKFVTDRIDGVKSYHITPNLNFKVRELQYIRRSIFCLSYYILSYEIAGDNESDQLEYIGFLLSKIEPVLNRLGNMSVIPRYLLDELAHVRSIVISVFYKNEEMRRRTDMEARQRLLIMESTEKEIEDRIDQTRETYEEAARKIISHEAHKIESDLLYDLDLSDNNRAKELIKKYG